jgi:hypothetical protein
LSFVVGRLAARPGPGTVGASRSTTSAQPHRAPELGNGGSPWFVVPTAGGEVRSTLRQHPDSRLPDGGGPQLEGEPGVLETIAGELLWSFVLDHRWGPGLVDSVLDEGSENLAPRVVDRDRVRRELDLGVEYVDNTTR